MRARRGFYRRPTRVPRSRTAPNSMRAHGGMSVPALSRAQKDALERHGVRWTGSDTFDGFRTSARTRAHDMGCDRARRASFFTCLACGSWGVERGAVCAMPLEGRVFTHAPTRAGHGVRRSDRDKFGHRSRRQTSTNFIARARVHRGVRGGDAGRYSDVRARDGVNARRRSMTWHQLSHRARA